MGKYTICVDFDGVIHSYTTPWIKPHIIPDPPVDRAIHWLWGMLRDFDVVIFSTRCKTWRARRAMRRWIQQHATPTQAPLLKALRYSYTKPAALIYLDDRAVRFQGPRTFPSKDEIHRRYIPWNRLAPPIGEIL